MYIKQYDDQYKLLIIGDVSVGKTSILNRFVDSLFYVNYVATIGLLYNLIMSKYLYIKKNQLLFIFKELIIKLKILF